MISADPLDLNFDSIKRIGDMELGFVGGSDDKESACNVGDPGLIPGSGRFSGEGTSYLLLPVLQIQLYLTFGKKRHMAFSRGLDKDCCISWIFLIWEKPQSSEFPLDYKNCT